MQLRQLEYVVALIQWKTMRKAAQHLYVSEATISQQIRELETELGLSLFQREGRGLKLTDEGEELLPFIERLLQARSDLEKQVAQMKAFIPDTLRFGVVPSIAWQFLPDILARFHAAYAQVRLEVQESPSYDLITRLQDQQIDVAVVAFSESVHFDLKGIVMKPLIRTELVALASSQHRLATQREITQKQLSREQLIVTREGFVARDLILTVLGNEIEKNSLYSTDNVLTSLKLVQSGTGILFLPRFIMTEANATQWHNLRILSLAPELTFPLTYVCLYLTQHRRPPWFHAFLSLLQACCCTSELTTRLR